MELLDAASWVSQRIRNKLTDEQLIQIMDAVQRLGFDENLQAFKVWTDSLSIYQTLTFVSAGYTAAVAGDIGRAVVGAGGAEGTLIAYDNDAREWVVDTEEDFEDGEAVTLTGGTGAGTLEAEDAQEGYRGPYAFPTYTGGQPKVRKFLGVTTVTDAAIFGSDVQLRSSDDYGMLPCSLDASRFFEGGRADEVGQTFTFAGAPARSDNRRWVYWMEAPAITGLDDDANFLVPKRYHFNFISACVKCAELTIDGRSFTRKDVEEDLGGWWNSLRQKYTPNGRARNLTQGAQYSNTLL